VSSVREVVGDQNLVGGELGFEHHFDAFSGEADVLSVGPRVRAETNIAVVSDSMDRPEFRAQRCQE